MIQRGELDAAVAGGTEAAVSPGAVAGFAAMKALSTRNDDPAHSSRPFDKDRDGFVMGEGAGVVFLEELEHAKKRGAHIYCEIGGYGSNADAYHITAPAPEGIQQSKCMALAVKDAGLQPEDVDYVNAHGTSTHLNDLNESKAIARVFGAVGYGEDPYCQKAAELIRGLCKKEKAAVHFLANSRIPTSGSTDYL